MVDLRSSLPTKDSASSEEDNFELIDGQPTVLAKKLKENDLEDVENQSVGKNKSVSLKPDAEGNAYTTAVFLTLTLIGIVATYNFEKSSFDSIKRAVEANGVDHAKVAYERHKILEDRFNKLEKLIIEASETDQLKREIAEIRQENERLKHIEETVQFRTVAFSRGRDGRFGISNFRSMIKKVVSGSPADLNGVKKGDQIISINGIAFETLSNEGMRKLLDNGKLTTFVLQQNPACMRDITEVLSNTDKKTKNMEEELKTKDDANNQLIRDRDEYKRQIEILESDNKKLRSTEHVKMMPPTRSVTVSVGRNGLFGIERIMTSITKPQPGSSAESNGVLRGDQIITIDGVNIEGKTRKEIAMIFKKARATGTTTLVLQHNAELLKQMELIDGPKREETTEASESIYRSVTLSRGADGRFGFYHRGNRVTGLYAESPAELGGMRRGDEIISINGISLENKTSEYVLSILKHLNEFGGSDAAFVLRNTPV